VNQGKTEPQGTTPYRKPSCPTQQKSGSFFAARPEQKAKNGSGELNWLRTRPHQIACKDYHIIGKCPSIDHCISGEWSHHCCSLKTIVIPSSSIKTFVWLPCCH